MLTFAFGTGEFAGSNGVVIGEGFVHTTGFTASGSGTMTATGVYAPELGSLVLLFGGLGFWLSRAGCDVKLFEGTVLPSTSVIHSRLF